MANRRLTRVFIANRGEIAVRVARAARSRGMSVVCAYSDADRDAFHLRFADLAVALGDAEPRQSYLHAGKLVDAARRTGCDCVHPGYGFLSEDAAFAASVRDAGLVFVGPPPEAIAAMGDKSGARRLLSGTGVPPVPGFDAPGATDARLAAAAREIGFPVIVKPAAGGGGKGMRVVRSAGEMEASLAAARRESLSAFGRDDLLVERLIEHPRHVEVQVAADEHGGLVHLFERECSIQRRHQKIIEEAPAPGLTDEARVRMCAAALAVARKVSYRNVGTVEFVTAPDGSFYFLEMNTRVQVEHPVTETVTGVDIVRLQFDLAEGAALPFRQEEVARRGHAVEARVYAEDPERGFLPTPGRVLAWEEPQGFGVRTDAGIAAGSVVPVQYDPILAKVVCWGATRAEAASRLDAALADTVLLGIRSNVSFLRDVVSHPAFLAGSLHTGFLEEHLRGWRHDAHGADAALVCAAALESAAPPAAGAGARDLSGPLADAGPWARLGRFRIAEAP